MERGEGFHEAAELHGFERLFAARVDAHRQFVDVVNRIFQPSILADVGEPDDARFAVERDGFGNFFVIGPADFGKNRVVAGPAVGFHLFGVKGVVFHGDVVAVAEGKADITKLNFEDNSINSLSCMHVVEHIGLGRYGDEIDPNGDIKAINELKRVTAKNGDLLFVVPVGKPRVQFNAHRIYSYEMIIEYFNGFELIDYCLIPDNANKNINFY